MSRPSAGYLRSSPPSSQTQHKQEARSNHLQWTVQRVQRFLLNLFSKFDDLQEPKSVRQLRLIASCKIRTELRSVTYAALCSHLELSEGERRDHSVGQSYADDWLTVREVFLELQSVELESVPSTGGQTAVMLDEDVRPAGVVVVDGLGGVEDVPGEERDHPVTTLRPHRQPGAQPGLLPLLAVPLHLPLRGEVEQLAQLIDLGRGQPELGLVELVEEEGGLPPLLGRDLLLVLQAGGESVQGRLVEYRVEPSVSLLVEISRSQPVGPLLEGPEVGRQSEVSVDLQESPGVSLNLNTSPQCQAGQGRVSPSPASLTARPCRPSH